MTPRSATTLCSARRVATATTRAGAGLIRPRAQPVSRHRPVRHALRRHLERQASKNEDVDITTTPLTGAKHGSVSRRDQNMGPQQQRLLHLPRPSSTIHQWRTPQRASRLHDRVLLPGHPHQVRQAGRVRVDSTANSRGPTSRARTPDGSKPSSRTTHRLPPRT